ncbi:MAG: hypothetical protein LCH39_00170 [Proteobacteria bacterium]|nr:hypothetical protein [Pseudomonadota bacterium]
MSEAILVGVLCAGVAVLAVAVATPLSVVSGAAIAILSGAAGSTMMLIGGEET